MRHWSGLELPETLHIHEPLLVNTLGHSIGVFVFAILIYLFLRDWRAASSRRSLLPALAAALALLWNFGSLTVLALADTSGHHSAGVVALSFSVLSVLPAVLLHISLGERMPLIRLGGYGLSVAAVGLHVTEIFSPVKSSLHEMALMLISAGFGSITILVALLHLFTRGETRNGRVLTQSLTRIVGTMAFFLFAMSFVHFGSMHGPEVWSAEAALHHAGIPLALVVLLQEYRFLLLDTFLRFLANAALASGIIVTGMMLDERYGFVARAGDSSFVQALVILLAAGTLIVFGYLRTGLQHLLTRVVFRRAALENTLQAIRADAMSAVNLNGILDAAGRHVAAYIGAEQWEWRAATPEDARSEPGLVSHFVRWRPAAACAWSEAVMPVWISQEGCRLLLLGRRNGGRRYLSEDLLSLARLAKVTGEEAERLRASELRRLVSEAEYRALQAQINPHFLFNSLNALYGTIPRQAEGARRMVLNLSQVFRYFLRSDRISLPLSEELAIVQAYLEIEKLRLGDRLQVEIAVSPESLGVHVPVLAIQPLVENAIKHGVASKPGPGWVRLSAHVAGRKLRVGVADSGGTFSPGPRSPNQRPPDGAGLGLENVRQRLRLCYGPQSDIDVTCGVDGTVVSFEIPLDTVHEPAHRQELAAHVSNTPA